MDPCTTYHFKIVDINQLGEDTIKAAETSAKTDCKEIPSTTTTEIPAQIIGILIITVIEFLRIFEFRYWHLKFMLEL